MFIAHLPSGYIAAKHLSQKMDVSPSTLKWFFFWGMFGSIAPDLDMFYFYFIDHRQHNHHSYWSHYPALWVPLLLACYYGYRKVKTPRIKQRLLFASIFAFAGCIHLVLDSIVGGIWWLAPFVNKPYSMFSMSPSYKILGTKYLLSWAFIFEIIIIAYAAFLWRKSNPTKNLSDIKNDIKQFFS